MSKGPLAAVDDQDKLLSEALRQVDTNAFEMKTCLDNGKLMDSLKHASAMLSELRTSLLSPKSYYELYMAISDQLHHLEQFLLEEFDKGKKMSDLYELVQYAGNIVPRLYLLVTVGTVYIKAHEGSRRDILRDLVEMCRGVQHPLRGLFLRNYLLQCTRNLLPDLETKDEQDGSVQDSINFISHNFSEMNKLWVRMQHQGHTKEKEKREKERLELRILVGTNLVRLSQLEAIDSALYQKSVLPSILEQVVKCRDAIAQEYLLECIIQVFPDDFHLQTLNPLLQTCAELQEHVNVKEIVIALVDRLASYAHRTDSSGIPSNIKLFDIFQQEIAIVIQSRPTMELEDIVALHVSLVNLGIKCYSERIDYVDTALQYCADLLDKKGASSVASNTPAGRELQKILKVPIDNYDDILTVLNIEHYPVLYKLFDYEGRKSLSLYLLQALLEKDAVITTTSQVESLFELLSPLLMDQDDQPQNEVDPEDFAEEQSMVARLIHLFKAPSPDQQYQILNGSRKKFGAGGDDRIKHTLPPLIFTTYRLIMFYRSVQDEDPKWHAKCEKIFKFCLSTLDALCKLVPELTLRLFLQGALTADQIASETIAYEFVTQAFTLYEEDISDSREQVNSLTLIMATFERMRCLGSDNHEALRTKCAVAASRLLKKPDQSRCVSLCAHLFWSGHINEDNDVTMIRDGKRVTECLKKSGRIATQCMDTLAQAQLFVELLNMYILFRDKGNTEITQQVIKQLYDKVQGDVDALDEGEETSVLKVHLNNTKAHLKKSGSKAKVNGDSKNDGEL